MPEGLFCEKGQDLLPFVSDQVLSLVAPIAVYWCYSGLFELIDYLSIPFLEQYRIHTPAELTSRNKVQLLCVIRDVIVQQIVQVICGLIMLRYEEEPCYVPHSLGKAVLKRDIFHFLGHSPLVESVSMPLANLLFYVAIPGFQMFVAILILDTWQYFWHRGMHLNRTLYKYIHSRHHRLYVPFACGALYNHPLEGLILDTLGAGIAFKVSQMSLRMGILFFVFSTLKTVDDHCGYVFPWDPLQIFFHNNSQYHDIHHQSYGIKRNFSQPFFTFCTSCSLGVMLMSGDHLLDTHMGLEETPTARRKAREAAKEELRDGELSSDGDTKYDDGALLSVNGSTPVVQKEDVDYNTVPISNAQARDMKRHLRSKRVD